MIKGIGVDIIEIGRVQQSIADAGQHFLQRVFTEGEIAYCSAKPAAAQHFAARFAAKEALSKALSTGWAGPFRWKDVEIANEPTGQPRIVLHGSLRESLARCAVSVSLSHADAYVVAMVIIEEL
jgi:holo-[acyl-carrier protein] synthase